MNTSVQHTQTKTATRQVVFLFLFFIFSLATNAQAQNRVTLNLDNADILDLVRWAQDVTPKTIIVHPNVQGRVTVIAGDPMTKDEAYQLFLSVLDVNGFGIIDAPQSIKILPNNVANQTRVPVKDGSDTARPEDLVIRILKVRNVSASQLTAVIKPLAGKDAYITPYSATNSIIVADRAGNIDELVKLVSRIDQVGVVDIDLIPIKFANASDLVSIINSLLPQAQQNESQSLKLAVDERSNSILVTGDPAARTQINRLIERLDTPIQGEGNTQVIYLNYADANELVPILQSVSGSEQKNDKDRTLNNAEVNIQASETLNALIITAPSSLLAAMKSVIYKLDVRRAQVLVEAIIVEVNEDLNTNYGVEWRVPGNGVDEEVISGFSSFPSNISPLSFEDTGEISLGSGFSLGYLKSGSLRAVISALKGEANANILSTPTIMALDNEEAQILVGENVPFVTGSQLNDGQTDPFQTIERKDIGVSLRIVPRINNDNSVTLEIEQAVESIGQTDVETADIITNKREIKTRVLIGDGETLVLGGLVRDEVSEAESRVPVLGSIPLFGRLFRSTSSTTVKRNLMVFIRPQILADAQSGINESSSRYQYMKEKQNDFRNRVDSFFVPDDLPSLERLEK